MQMRPSLREMPMQVAVNQGVLKWPGLVDCFDVQNDQSPVRELKHQEYKLVAST